ncbi:MAG TPA: WbqC family protein [Chitinophagaceae bacterium]|nr:WbqC family protein [Chitinophagaceae bacterium]
MSFMNRAVIPAANGLTTLSIPLVGGRETKQVLKDVRIDNSQHWQVRHWRTITSAYRRSPWFEFYEPGLAALYEKQFDLLHEWNLELMKWVLQALKANIELGTLEERNPEFVLDPREICKPSNFQNQVFTRDLPIYPQVFQDRLGFQPNVSIIDLIFNEGNQSLSLLTKASY